MDKKNICNICGSNLIVVNGRFKCGACGAYAPVSITNDENILLVNAFQNIRLKRFDDAYDQFEDITKKYPDSSSAYWGLVCSEYGIVLEEDYDGKKIPSCYNTSYESFFENKNYKKAYELADNLEKEYYQEQANKIELIRKEWIDKASKESPYDIFLSYKSSDDNGKTTEDEKDVIELYHFLKDKGYKVFFSKVSLENKAGEKYEPYIFNALNTSKTMIVYGSKAEYFESTWVKNEWSRYLKRINNRLKSENSLIVIYKDFNPKHLPKLLSNRQAIDRNSMNFKDILSNTLEKVFSDILNVPKIKRNQIRDIKAKERAEYQTIKKKSLINNEEKKKNDSSLNCDINKRTIGNYSVPKLSSSAESTLKIAKSYFDGNDYETAQKEYEKILINDPNNPVALKGKILCLNKKNSFDELFVVPFKNIIEYGLLIKYIDYAKKDDAEKLLSLIVTYCKKGVYKDNSSVLCAYELICEYNSPSVNELHEYLINKLVYSLNDSNSLSIIDISIKYISNDETVFENNLKLIIRRAIDDSLFDIAKRYFEQYKLISIFDYDFYIFDLCIKYNKNTIYQVLNVVEEEKKINIIEEIVSESSADVSNAILKDCSLVALQSLRTKAYKSTLYWIKYLLEYDYEFRNEFVDKLFDYCYENPSNEILEIFDYLIKIYKLDDYLKTCQTFAGYSLKKEKYVIADKYFSIVLDYEPYNIESIYGKWCSELKINDKNNIKDNLYKFTDFSLFEHLLAALKNNNDDFVKTITQYSNYCIEYVNINNHLDLNIFDSFENIISFYPEYTSDIYNNVIKEMAKVCHKRELWYYSERYYALVCSNNPNEYEAYWGLLQSKLKCVDNDGLIHQYVLIDTFDEYNNTLNAASKSDVDINIYTNCLIEQKNWIDSSLKKKKIIKRTVIISSIVFACSIIIGLLLSLWIIPNYRYNKAMDLLADGNYEEAREILDDINYSDSKKQVAMIDANDAFKSGDYEKGIDYIYKIGGTVDVSYNSNGGTSNKSSETIKLMSYIDNDTNKNGYSFVKWNLNSYDIDFKKYNATIKLDAVYSINTYRITYELNGGVLTNSIKRYNIEETITIDNPIKDNYYFLGWNVNGSTDLIKNYSFTHETGDKTLVANWIYYAYTITYNLDGATKNANPDGYNYDSETITLVNPEKTGYTFLGWTTDGVTTPTKGLTIEHNSTGNKIYTANWEANTYTITYDVNGGNALSETTQNVVYDSNYTFVTPSRPGYTFEGWYVGNVEYISGKWDRTSNVSLTAKWEIIPYIITYNLDGATVNNNPKGYNYESETITLVDPEKTGYTFLGWTTSGVTTPTKGLTIEHNSTGNKIYTANWEANTYTITYDVNGGNALSETTQDVVYDSNYTLVTPSRPGYTFEGWYIGTTQFTVGKWNRTDNVTITAKWEIIPYTITYNLDGATVNNPEGYNYESETITLVDPEKTGYTFLGWTTSGVTTPTKGLTIEHNSTGDKTFTAHLEANTYTITYDVNGGNALLENTQNVVYDSNYTLVTPSRPGYTFDGWYIGTTQFTAGKWNRTDNVTITAKWEIIPYTITYNLDGATKNTNPEGYNYDSETITLVDPEKTGYTFLGWTTSGVTTPTKGLTIEHNSTGDKTFTAHWEANLNAIILNNNGNVNVIKGYTDSYITLPCNEIELTGKLFEGWAETNNGEIKYKDRDLYYVPTSSSTTLYAIWTNYEDYIEIKTKDQLKNIKADKKYYLANDINMENEIWYGISSFTGVLDGRGYSIYNFTLTISDVSYDKAESPYSHEHDYSYYTGLIKNNSGIIKNVNFYDVNFDYSSISHESYHKCSNVTYTYEYKYYFGVIAAINNGTIDNCSVSIDQYMHFTKRVQYYYGSICAMNYGTIKDCASYTSLSLSGIINRVDYENNSVGYTTWPYFYFGGICATNESSIFNMYVNSHILDSICTNNMYGNNAGYHSVLGAIGYSTEKVTNSYYYGNLNPISSNFENGFSVKTSDVLFDYKNCISYVIEGKHYYQFFESHEAMKALNINYSKVGYTLIGWSLSNDGEVLYGVDDYVQLPYNLNSQILYAVFSKNKVQLTFDSNGGSGSMDSIEGYVDTQLTLPACTFVAKDGYHFKGWSHYTNGSIVAYDKGEYTPNGTNTVLYAIWEANENTIIFDVNGGSGEMTEQTVKTNNTVILNQCTLSAPNGYYFAGWSTTSSGNVEYTDCDNFTSGTASTYILYAVWKEI